MQAGTALGHSLILLGRPEPFMQGGEARDNWLNLMDRPGPFMYTGTTLEPRLTLISHPCYAGRDGLSATPDLKKPVRPFSAKVKRL